MSNYERSESSLWALSARAKDHVKAATLDYKKILKRISKRPELEADMRAGASFDSVS